MAVNTNTMISNIYSQNYTQNSKGSSKTSKDSETTEVKKEEKVTESKDYGKTIGDPTLSKEAQKYYERLKKKYGNYDHTSIKWQGSAPYYNLYSSDTFPVDTDAPCNLVAQRIQTNKIIIKTSSPRFYALRAMDRYGIESDAVQNYSLPKAESLLIAYRGSIFITDCIL